MYMLHLVAGAGEAARNGDLKIVTCSADVRVDGVDRGSARTFLSSRSILRMYFLGNWKFLSFCASDSSPLDDVLRSSLS